HKNLAKKLRKALERWEFLQGKYASNDINKAMRVYSARMKEESFGFFGGRMDKYEDDEDSLVAPEKEPSVYGRTITEAKVQKRVQT
ncbi:unnamed protein product, partial [Heterosigma akashiwo]